MPSGFSWTVKGGKGRPESIASFFAQLRKSWTVKGAGGIGVGGGVRNQLLLCVVV